MDQQDYPETDMQRLQELQRRAEAMTRGDFSTVGQPIGGIPSIEDLRRAIDVLGMHTEQGLRSRHAYIAALTTAQEAERGRLARELHDEIVQQLIALGHSIERTQRLLEHDPAQAAERLHSARASVTALVQELRTIISDLRPPALEELGLLPAIDLLLQQSAEGAPEATVTVEGAEQRLAPQTELALFRIIQEAWSNIRRHARARMADVHFAYTGAGLIVTISDDGQGFTPPDDQDMLDGHWGVRGMRERAELGGGSLTLTSQPGQGARIEVFIPYPGIHGRDPVCGMSVNPDYIGAEHAGKLYRFCSPACRDLFQAQPERYIAAR
ncbi:MAG: histidine kinase [Chloroflexales bacterium]|nr:histidine kinase [Chloroflexales bacterium]